MGDRLNVLNQGIREAEEHFRRVADKKLNLPNYKDRVRTIMMQVEKETSSKFDETDKSKQLLSHFF